MERAEGVEIKGEEGEQGWEHSGKDTAREHVLAYTSVPSTEATHGVCGDIGSPLHLRERKRKSQTEDGCEWLEVADTGGEEGDAAEKGDRGFRDTVEDVEGCDDESNGKEDGSESIRSAGEGSHDGDEPHEEEAELSLMDGADLTESCSGVESDLSAWNTLLWMRRGKERYRLVVVV